MKNYEAIKALLFTAIDDIAANPEKYASNPEKDFTRNRKLGFKDTLLMLLTMEADCLKEELYRYFGRNTAAPSKSAFYKQRRKLNHRALANLLFAFNSKLPKNLYKGKYQFFACDGSTVEVFHDSNNQDTYFEPNGKSKRGYNQLHINALHSILDKRFIDLVTQPARKKNEYSAFCELVDSVGNDGSVIYFADMGYASYNNFAHVIENGQYFLIRANDKRTGRILGRSMEGLKEADVHVDRILTRTQSKKKRTLPDQPELYRYISKGVSFDYLNDEHTEYKISLRIVRFEIAPNCFENIVTNLPECEFDFEDFKDLYHMRWIEETAFRDLKYTLCLNAFHSKKDEYVEQEIWARTILYNFSTAIISKVEIEKKNTKYKYQVNFAEAFKTCRDFLRMHDRKKKIDVEAVIAQNTEAIRPDRSFSRNHRFHLPFKFIYRN